jgi:hypothetical protein
MSVFVAEFAVVAVPAPSEKSWMRSSRYIQLTDVDGHTFSATLGSNPYRQMSAGCRGAASCVSALIKRSDCRNKIYCDAKDLLREVAGRFYVVGVDFFEVSPRTR